MARVGREADRGALLASLAQLKLSALDEGETLGMLRAYALIFMRLGEATEIEKSGVVSFLNQLYPSAYEDVNTELVRLYVFLDAPDVVARTLALIKDNRKEAPAPWVSVLERNRGYGSAIIKMLSNPPPTREINYAFMLRNVRYGWSLPQRREYFVFINEAAKFQGGNSYSSYLENIREDALKNCSDAERVALADLTGENLSPKLGFEVVAAAGPGRNWSVSEALDVVKASGSRHYDFTRGQNLLHAAACASCHRFDGSGGDIGPDLTTVRSRFSIEELLESIIEPSKTISDQYSSSTVTLQDGRLHTGLVIRDDASLIVHSNDPNAAPTTVKLSNVASVVASPISQMPPGLINGLNPDELRDLIAYLMSRGNPKDPVYEVHRP